MTVYEAHRITDFTKKVTRGRECFYSHDRMKVSTITMQIEKEKYTFRCAMKYEL